MLYLFYINQIMCRVGEVELCTPKETFSSNKSSNKRLGPILISSLGEKVPLLLLLKKQNISKSVIDPVSRMIAG